jgi:7-cyano-7-deazaguanine reductase
MTLRSRQSARDRKATPLSLSPAGRGLSAAILRAKPRKSRGGKGEGAFCMGKKELPVTILGSAAKIPETPSEATLERVPNPHPDANYVARFAAPEFTCLCPVTGQPDFAHLVIDYAPKHWLVESKSLKLFLASFRNHGAFHEDSTIAVGKRIVELIEPHYLRIGGYWYPRGGMPIDVFWQTGTLPAGIWLPDQGVAPYRGRG